MGGRGVSLLNKDWPERRNGFQADLRRGHLLVAEHDLAKLKSNARVVYDAGNLGCQGHGAHMCKESVTLSPSKFPELENERVGGGDHGTHPRRT